MQSYFLESFPFLPSAWGLPKGIGGLLLSLSHPPATDSVLLVSPSLFLFLVQAGGDPGNNLSLNDANNSIHRKCLVKAHKTSGFPLLFLLGQEMFVALVLVSLLL